MKILKFKEKRKRSYFGGVGIPMLTLALGGTLAGFFNGLLGAGGGIILVFALARIVEKTDEGARSVYANALCVMLPLSLFTLFRYASKGVFSPDFTGELSAEYILGAIIGGALGGILLGKLRGGRLRKLFALLTLVSGILMITR